MWTRHRSLLMNLSPCVIRSNGNLDHLIFIGETFDSTEKSEPYQGSLAGDISEFTLTSRKTVNSEKKGLPVRI